MGADVILAAAIGFAMGAAAATLLGGLGMRGRSGRTYHFGSNRSLFAPLVRSPQQLSPAEIARFRRHADLTVAIPASPLRGVIAVGASSVVGDLTVELIAIEVREAGCRGMLRFRSGERAIVEGRSVTVFGEPEVTVADDVGTRYETGLAGWSGSAEGGEAEFSFAPRPPANAHRLSIVIERFRESRLPLDHPLSGPPEGIAGPWHFTAEVTDHPASQTEANE